MSYLLKCRVLSGWDLYVRLITRPEESTECSVSECDREASIMRKSWPTSGCWPWGKKRCVLGIKTETRFFLIFAVGRLKFLHGKAILVYVKKLY
jgi:hypothetical protein